MASITDGNIVVANQGKNPLVNYNFMLRVELAFDVPCKSVKAFSRDLEFEYIQEGGLNDYVHMRRKPITHPFILEVERYVGVDYLDPLPLGTDLVLPMMLFVSRYPNMFIPGVVARTYVFTGCTVMKKTYGDLVADQSGLLVETTTIGYREMVCADMPWSEVMGGNPMDDLKQDMSASRAKSAPPPAEKPAPPKQEEKPKVEEEKKKPEEKKPNEEALRYKEKGQKEFEEAQEAKEKAEELIKSQELDTIVLDLDKAIEELEKALEPTGALGKPEQEAREALEEKERLEGEAKTAVTNAEADLKTKKDTLADARSAEQQQKEALDAAKAAATAEGKDPESVDHSAYDAAVQARTTAESDVETAEATLGDAKAAAEEAAEATNTARTTHQEAADDLESATELLSPMKNNHTNLDLCRSELPARTEAMNNTFNTCKEDNDKLQAMPDDSVEETKSGYQTVKASAGTAKDAANKIEDVSQYIEMAKLQLKSKEALLSGGTAPKT